MLDCHIEKERERECENTTSTVEDMCAHSHAYLNGLVTTAAVKIPASRHASAITGAAPVPVPPPMPAVMNTMWLPSMNAMISSCDSMAAALPASGFAPHPSPWVVYM